MKYARLSPGSGFNPFYAALFYAQRITTPLMLRRLVVAVISTVVRLLERQPDKVNTVSSEGTRLLEKLSENGYASLGGLFSPQQCEEIRAFLNDKLLTDRDTGRPRFTVADAPPSMRVADYDLLDVVRCPHVLELANSPLLIDVATRYIGCKPTISNLGVRWSIPEPMGRSVLQGFHRDCEDWRYFKVLVYLTDVDESGGPHVFVQGTHRTRGPVRLAYLSDEEVRLKHGSENMLVVKGRAGEGFAVDTSGIHKGTAPTAAPRLMFQLQYSLLPCFAYDYEPIASDVDLALDPYINRLFVKPGADPISRE